MSNLDIAPERACLAACLERAILDATGNTCGPDKYGRLKREARTWIFLWCRQIEYPEWSFPWVCENLDLCPFRIRRAVKRELRKRERMTRTQFNMLRFVTSLLQTTATNAEVYYR